MNQRNEATRTLGLIVNPIAGMGGSVGLKGTDGPGMAARARELGAVPRSRERARQALEIVARALGEGVTIVAAPGEMGGEIARAAGFATWEVGEIGTGPTSGADTERAAGVIAAAGVELLIFAGGDGTARDVCRAIGTTLPAVGVPTGVKMHSAVYARNPRAAGELVVRFLADPSAPCREGEVMDIDEDAFRDGRVSARLYGYLRVPRAATLMQGRKSGRGGGAAGELASLAAEVADRMGDGAIYALGPGTTTRAIAERLGIAKTLLGVDVVYRGELVGRDVTERDLLEHLASGPARIVVTPIGGQGYLFGRGNQQLSPAVIRLVGRANIMVVATPGKLAELGGRPFLVDTGDAEVDGLLAGYVRVVTGFWSEVVYRVEG